MTLDDLMEMAVVFLAGKRPDLEDALRKLGPGDDLFETGAVDSHVFIDLCLAIEERTGVFVDIAELEPEEFSSISGLHRIVSSARGAPA